MVTFSKRNKKKSIRLEKVSSAVVPIFKVQRSEIRIKSFPFRIGPFLKGETKQF